MVKDSDFNGFGEEEITEFNANEFSYGDSAPAASSAAPEEIPVDYIFGDKDPEKLVEEKVPSEFVEGKEDDEDGNDNAPSQKNVILKEILSWVRTVAIGVLIGIFLVVFVVQRDNVYGDSMEPTLYSGDVVFTQKIATYFDSYKRGDIVILDGEGMENYDREEYLIKRVIGLPGETVRIDNGNVYIKPVDSDEFFLLEEPYIGEEVQTLMMTYGIEHGYDEITLGENEYYCLGDNRAVSKDSRLLGPFTADRIKGIAMISVYPFDHFGIIG